MHKNISDKNIELGLFRKETYPNKLQNELDLIDSVFDTIDSIVLITDKNGKIILANKAFLKFTGYSTEEIS